MMLARGPCDRARSEVAGQVASVDAVVTHGRKSAFRQDGPPPIRRQGPSFLGDALNPNRTFSKRSPESLCQESATGI
jgi:hypothetical protein